MDRLTEMEVFIAVVDERGFTQAANKLGLSKSAVSKHVASLEDRLGVALLNRTTRKVSATEIGRQFYVESSLAVDQAQAAELAAKAHQKTPIGKLRVSVPSDFATTTLAPIVSDFLKAYPDLGLDLDLDNRFVDITGEGYDAAIRIGTLADSSLMARKLAQSKVMVVASRDYFDAHGRPQSFAELTEHKLIGYSRGRGPSIFRVSDIEGQKHIFRIDQALTINNGSMIAQAAVSGIGVATSPCFVCWELVKQGQLEEVLVDQSPDRLDIHVVYPPASYTQPKLRAFIDFMVAAFKGKGEGNW